MEYDLRHHDDTSWLVHHSTPGRFAAGDGFAELEFFDWKKEMALKISPTLPAMMREFDGEVIDSIIEYEWARFGVRNQKKVPPWRQSLYGAWSLRRSYPPAAIVLIATGFESFFRETMGIKWKESGLAESDYRQLRESNVRISQLVKWLPSVVGAQSMLAAEGGLYRRWFESVNKRRNSVVHGAEVSFTYEQAQESMATALECITWIDPFALSRPHVYYTEDVFARGEDGELDD